MELRFYFETTVNRIYLKRKTIGVRLVLIPEWVKSNHVLNSIFHRLLLLQMTIKLPVTMYTCNLCLSINPEKFRLLIFFLRSCILNT